MLPSQSARSSIKMTQNNEEKGGGAQQDKGDVKWLNERYAGKREEKETTHPCWHTQRLITMAAVSTDVGLRGSCQSLCVCKYARLYVCVCVYVW